MKLIDLMKNGNGTSIYMLLGLTASEIRRAPLLKFCPKCVVEDEDRFGEAYWHRSHQAFGVSVCYKHMCGLVDSDIEVDQRHKHEMFTLNNYLRRRGYSLNTVVATPDIKQEFFIAQQSYVLLNNSFLSQGIDQIRKYYVTRLQAKGLATESGRIRWLEFLPLFNQYYGRDFLLKFSSYVQSGDEDTWLHKLLRSPRVTCHPLRHILFLGFVNESVSSLCSVENYKTEQPVFLKENRSDAKLVLKKEISNNRINWPRRDIEISDEIRKVASNIVDNETKLVRITRTEIGRTLRVQSLLIRTHSKLPMTQEALNEVVESLEQFQIRRIKWAVQHLMKQKMNVQAWEVFKVAGIKQKFEDKYRSLIEEEINCFQ